MMVLIIILLLLLVLWSLGLLSVLVVSIWRTNISKTRMIRVPTCKVLGVMMYMMPTTSLETTTTTHMMTRRSGALHTTAHKTLASLANPATITIQAMAWPTQAFIMTAKTMVTVVERLHQVVTTAAAAIVEMEIAVGIVETAVTVATEIAVVIATVVIAVAKVDGVADDLNIEFIQDGSM